MADGLIVENQEVINNITDAFDLKYLTEGDLDDLICAYDIVDLNPVNLIDVGAVAGRAGHSFISHLTDEAEAQGFNAFKKTHTNDLAFATALLLAAFPYLKAVRVQIKMDYGETFYDWYLADDTQLEIFENHPGKNNWLNKFARQMGVHCAGVAYEVL
jgi:hypothetical protein